MNDKLLALGFTYNGQVFKLERNGFVVTVRPSDRSVLTHVPDNTFSKYTVFGNIQIARDEDILEAVRASLELIK